MDEAVESGASDSEADDDDDDEGFVPRISEKKKADLATFSAWVQKQTNKITKDEVQAVLNQSSEETMTARSLIAKQESEVIITTPREYQVELFEKAKNQNIIAVLDTGSGKTLIAVLLLKYIIDQELEQRAMGKKRRISFFLVDSVTLVFQQYAVLECNLDQKIANFCGAMGTDLWSKAAWRTHFDENMVIVCTAEILSQCLSKAFITLDEINLLIFDEAHHTKKNHPYAVIIKDHYRNQSDASKRPKVFGMTASPVDAKVDDVRKAARDLEELLDCQIATTSDLALLRMSISRPKEQILTYETLRPPYDTKLCAKLRSEFSDLDSLRKIFRFANEAASQLGEWCADQYWRFALAEEESQKVEQKIEQKFLREKESLPIDILDKELVRLREAKHVVRYWPFPPLNLEVNNVSPKVRRLVHFLLQVYKNPTDARCIIFTKQRKTARLLSQLLKELRNPYLCCSILIGSGEGDFGDSRFSFREQILTLMKFKSGELNCLIATSIAEEGLDIPDCNLVIRFDLYVTLIQYVQSRGRARHANSGYIHMVETGNQQHLQAVKDVQAGEHVMRMFCEALPADRMLEGNDENFDLALAKDRGQRTYVDPETGAKLNYANSLVILAHFVSCLPQSGDVPERAAYSVKPESGQFVCEVTLPSSSPIRSAIGRPRSRKSIAKRSAAFEACRLLRQNEYIDGNLIPIYHKYLPKMRNAHLAINHNKKDSFVMKIKPSLWEQTRGSRPEKLFVMVIELQHPDRLGRPSQPLAFLTRTCMPQIPSFPLHLQPGKVSNVLCRPYIQSFTTDPTELNDLTVFTLRIYKDVFNKTFEKNEAEMTYWLAPVILGPRLPMGKDQSPKTLLDWNVLTSIRQSPEIRWSADLPSHHLVDRYIIDPWDGGRRFFSLAIEPSLRPHDPVPGDAAKHRYMKDILDYSVSLFSKSRTRATWKEEQPVIRAERILHRLNWLDEFSSKEQEVNTKAYLCPEPLIFSALPITIVSMSYLFSAVMYRIDSYLIALEACNSLGLSVKPELALEAVTKDSDNTEEHRSEQIHVQRGMGKNYERLEFIGDCFLKMATSISLFSLEQERDEFEYHVRRMLMICNQNLLQHALEHELYKYIRTKGFSRRTCQSSWNNISQHLEKDARKEDQLKRKPVQSPRLSGGALPQSPLSSKSGEFSSGSVGPHFGAVGTTAALAASQKDKAAVNSVPAVGGTPSLMSSANDSLQRQHNTQVAAKRRSNSFPKTPAMSGVGSPSSGSNMSLPLNANSPSVGTSPMADQTMLEKFSKIEAVTMRYQLNCKKNKIDDHAIRKSSKYSVQELSHFLSRISNNEDFKDDVWPLSKSLVSGSMNNCKTRIINFLHPGNVVSLRSQTRMVMSMKPTDGTVAMHYGDSDEGDILAAEDYLPTLPNTHNADLLAQQFCKLMEHDGLLVEEDKIQLKQTHMHVASSSQNATILLRNNSAAEMQQYAEAASGQAPTEVAKPSSGGNTSLGSSQGVLGNTRMLPSGNPQALHMSQGLLSGVSMPSRPPQLDQQPSIQSQTQQQQQQQPLQPQQPQNQHSLIQQQHPQFQRSPMMLASNTLSHLNAIGQNSNLQLGNQMVNKPSPLQLNNMLQQQQQSQQPMQMQRKMMMGVGTAVGMGNMGNNTVRLGGLSNAVGIGGARGIGGAGISAPMIPISGMGNMGPNPINAISQQFRTGNAAQVAMMAKLRVANRSMLGGAQAGINAMSGARPGSPGLSMLGQNNQSNTNPMQRIAMGSMAPPKLAGMNLYMNQHQQQQQQLQMQQQQLQHQQQQSQLQQLQQYQLQQQPQQLQPQQLLQQQPETTSSLQPVVPPSQVGSPSTVGLPQLNQQPQQQQPQQQPSPQQINQRTPMSPQQMSSSAIHALSAGNNPEACPASPQLSSQTLGSVGSITNSPMELAVNKSNSVSNA